MAHYPWWQTGIIYQIYPRSFQDSNGDGIGDLPGIMRRLDYLQRLNIDAIWLSPIFASPMHDFGYDVSDYTAVHPIFGTMDDFDRLLSEVQRRGMKLLLDLVPNHTSSEHPWFVESRSSRTNPKRDWYIWRDPGPNGEPPNNWRSFFGGPAWTFDPEMGQYYLHQFLPQQPELNYRNPEVLQAILNAMRFWLDRGVDGFRVDVIWLMIKDELLRDEPIDPLWNGRKPHNELLHIYTQNQPEIHGLIRQMRAVLDEYDERVMVGEIYLPNEDLVQYYGEDCNECHLPFNFQLIGMQWDAELIGAAVEAYERVLPPGAWPNWVLGNHDRPRIAHRIGVEQARVAAMLLLTLRGTPTIYYGEEIGMDNGEIPPERWRDPEALRQPEVGDEVGRDPERTPMQWTGEPNAGFTVPDVEPWLLIAGNAPVCNVAAQENVPTSMLNLYRALTALRRYEPALHRGDFVSLAGRNPGVLAYLRIADDKRFLIVLNFNGHEVRTSYADIAPCARIAVSTDLIRAGEVNLAELTLDPDQGFVLDLG